MPHPLPLSTLCFLSKYGNTGRQIQRELLSNGYCCANADGDALALLRAAPYTFDACVAISYLMTSGPSATFN